jgi:hypothetical protein
MMTPNIMNGQTIAGGVQHAHECFLSFQFRVVPCSRAASSATTTAAWSVDVAVRHDADPVQSVQYMSSAMELPHNSVDERGGHRDQNIAVRVAIMFGAKSQLATIYM